MVQRFCLVSLTISNRKTSYRSPKQTAGSTSCPWTTILVEQIVDLTPIEKGGNMKKPSLESIPGHLNIFSSPEPKAPGEHII